MHIIHDGVTTTRESIAMISLYLFYVAFVVGRYLFNKKVEDLHHHHHDHHQKTTSEFDNQNSSFTTTQSQLQPPHEDCIHRLSNYFEIISKPLTFLFRMTIPSIRTETLENIQIQFIDEDNNNSNNNDRNFSESSSNQSSNEARQEKNINHQLHVCNPERYLSCIVRRQNKENLSSESTEQCQYSIIVGSNHVVGLLQASLCRALCCIAICIFYIAIFASLIVQACSVIVHHVGLSQTTIGATLVSLGTEVIILYFHD